MKNLLPKLKNKAILFATLGNVISILLLWGVIDTVKADTITKLGGVVLTILVQVGIFTDSSKENNGGNY